MKQQNRTPKNLKMRLVNTDLGYNFWVGTDENGQTFYNVTPIKEKRPSGGFYSSSHICRIKHVPNLFE